MLQTVKPYLQIYLPTVEEIGTEQVPTYYGVFINKNKYISFNEQKLLFA